MHILEFRGEYFFLSNFYIEKTGKSNEHYFQAGKTLDVEWAARIMAVPTARAAKKMGRICPLRPDWEEIKNDHMLATLRRKFELGSMLAGRLLATGDNHLVEGNDWNDQYWGQVDGQGQNWLGRLLMQVRDELQGTMLSTMGGVTK